MKAVLSSLVIKVMYIKVQSEFKMSPLPRHVKFHVLDQAYSMYGKGRFTTLAGLRFISKQLATLENELPYFN
jgi:hypothetical protein